MLTILTLVQLFTFAVQGEAFSTSYLPLRNQGRRTNVLPVPTSAGLATAFGVRPHQNVFSNGLGLRRVCPTSLLSVSVGGPFDDGKLPVPEKNDTPLRRMRRRKLKIYNKRRDVGVGLLLCLWYILSMAYNIINKRVLILAPELAWFAAWFQMSLGLFYVGPLWLSGVRKKPQLSMSEAKKLLPVAALHALVHIGGVVSMGAGAVSFTYIVKSSEPAVSALLAGLILNNYLPVPVYLTLIPVMMGVALSSVSELTFTWKAFNYAMMSNLASASRGIVGKKTLQDKELGKNLGAMNMYAVLTTMATVLIFPFALVLEGPVFAKTMRGLFEAGQGTSYLVQTLLAAFFYYTYNEVAFLCLDKISPVSHALANTLKRIFIIVSSMIVFGNKMTRQGILGSSMAVGGVLLYSLAKNKYKTTGLGRK